MATLLFYFKVNPLIAMPIGFAVDAYIMYNLVKLLT